MINVCMLTPSPLWCHLKTTHNNNPFSLFFFFSFFALACERIIMKTQNMESRCYRTRKSTVFRHFRASFCPEILQAVVVKGLILCS